MINFSSNNSIFDPKAVANNGMNRKLAFKICGYEAEPQMKWDDNMKKFTNEISGYGFWVCQNIKDDSGNLFVQNPIFVVIPGIDENYSSEFKFGDLVIFDNLGGFYSRKKSLWRWQANGIRKDK